MTEPHEPDEVPPQPPTPPQRSLGRRLVRSVFAPEVLKDGGRDAPLSPRGKLLFNGVVAILVIALVILFAITIATR